MLSFGFWNRPYCPLVFYIRTRLHSRTDRYYIDTSVNDLSSAQSRDMAAAAGHWPTDSIWYAHLHTYCSPACNMQMQIILCWISQNAIRIIDSRGCGFLANYTHEYSGRTTANCGFINGPPTGGGMQTYLLDRAPQCNMLFRLMNCAPPKARSGRHIDNLDQRRSAEDPPPATWPTISPFR